MTEDEYRSLKPGDTVSVTCEVMITKNDKFDSSGIHFAIDHGSFVEESSVAPMFMIKYGTIVSQD